MLYIGGSEGMVEDGEGTNHNRIWKVTKWVA